MFNLFISLLLFLSKISHRKMANYNEEWLQEMIKLTKKREQNIKKLEEAKYLDDQRLRSMDSTLKKVTAFTKKLKNIGSISASQFLPDLERYNLSKYLDEIAVNICEAKIKTSDLESLIEFCVKMASLYKDFPAHLIQAFRKQMPTKKGDKIENPSKLRVDLRFYSELLLNGVFIPLENNEGMKLLGSVLVYLIQTDKNEHLNVSILMPFCRNSLFTLTGIVPLAVINSTADEKEIPQQKLISKMIAEDKSILIGKLFNDYWDSLVEHANKVRQETNKLQKSIKRQERTRGDASAEDRQNFEQSKQTFDRLHQSAIDLGECLGKIVPEMAEEPSDDEKEGAEARRLDTELSQGRILLWPDRDTQLFYESLLDVTAYTPTLAAIDSSAAEQEQQNEQIVNESIENVDLSCLEEQPNLMQTEALESGIEVEEEIETFETDEQQNDEQNEDEALKLRQNSPGNNILPTGGPIQQSINFHELLERMPNCINKELVDAAAVDFLKNYSRNKAYRKKLIQHFLQCPVDRLDLLPFYARFMATVRPAYPEIPKQVMNELLTLFRSIVQQKNTEMEKNSAEIQPKMRIDSKLHICSYLSELCKFGILPKAEALTCLRSLLVQMRSFKVDMLCVMIEQMGPFLYRSPDAHSKMSVIMQVLKEKSQNVKDPRQKILLENAYFAVIPPDGQQEMGKPTVIHRQPPMQEFIQYKLATEIRVSIFRRINWDDEEIREFTLKLLSSPWRIHFGQLACLASLVSALGDHHDWIAVRVLDDVLEFIRLSLELNSPRLQQMTLSSVAYLGQLFNYNVSNTATLFKTFYQFISLGIDPPILVTDPSISIQLDQFVVRLQRIRLVCQLIDVVCEFFCTGKSKKRMDHFLCFFLRFYYETREGWSQFVEELDEFPDDVCQAVTDLLQTWRKGEQFPTTLAEARQKVEEIEQIYKTKVEEVLAGMRYAMESGKEGEEGGENIRLKRIMEEDEEEEESSTIDEEEDEEEDELVDEEEEGDEDDGRIGGRQRHKQMRNSNEEDEVEMHEFGDEEEQIRVRTNIPEKMLPEDEDFMRDFDRMMAESLQSAPITLQGPMIDLVVPPQAKQKFERKLTFAVNEIPKTMSGYADLFPSASENERNSLPNQSSNRMALMLRGGKGGGGIAGKSQILLKQVQIAESENLAEKWRQAKEEQERDRREMKKVTLALNERMAQEADEMHRQQQIADLERKMMFAKADEPNGNE